MLNRERFKCILRDIPQDLIDKTVDRAIGALSIKAHNEHPGCLYGFETDRPKHTEAGEIKIVVRLQVWEGGSVWSTGGD
jgi:hypothetical protein